MGGGIFYFWADLKQEGNHMNPEGGGDPCESICQTTDASAQVCAMTRSWYYRGEVVVNLAPGKRKHYTCFYHREFDMVAERAYEPISENYDGVQ